jgi:hypothetical protein
LHLPETIYSAVACVALEAAQWSDERTNASQRPRPSVRQAAPLESFDRGGEWFIIMRRRELFIIGDW